MEILSKKNPKTDNSAGLLMWDIINGVPKILLCHPGGPYYANKDAKGWSIPKGLIEGGEYKFAAAIREFFEETQISPPLQNIKYLDLGFVTYKSGKQVYAWAFQGKFPGKIISNKFEMESPKGSGKTEWFPENDKGEMFTLKEARDKIVVSQEPFLDKMEKWFKDNLYI